MLVLRLYEGVAEEQVAAALGLPVERVRELCTRGMAAMLSRVRRAARRGRARAARAASVSAAAQWSRASSPGSVTGHTAPRERGGDKEGVA